MHAAPPHAPRHVRTTGFTIVELLVVIAMLVIVMSISAPRIFRSLHMNRLRNEANFLLATLRYSQGMAAIQRAQHDIHFNLAKQTYYVTREASRGDDFEMEGTQLGTGTSSLFPGETVRYLPGEEETPEEEQPDDVWPEEGTPTNLRNRAGPVAIFDEERHEIPVGIMIHKIVDGRGEEITDGEFTLPLTPQGRAVHTSIYLGTMQESDPFYVVTVHANGLAEIEVEERTP
jgi:type II secretory pathway pseudopilin PulG